MILTVTLNAALDITYDVDELVPHASNRVTAVRQRAGGKGVNVASVLTLMGHPVTATGCAGGRTGADIRADLDARGVAHRFVDGAGDSRRTVTVVSAAHGDATVLNEPGPEVPAPVWASLVTGLADLVREQRAGVVVLSGSLPRGVPADAYSHLVATAHAHGARVVVDAEGAALRDAVTAGPEVVKPNRHELLSATGCTDVAAAVAALRALGARDVVVSDGADGVLVFPLRGRPLRARLPKPLSGNPTGAGDAHGRGARHPASRPGDAVAGDGQRGRWPGRPPRCCSRWPARSTPMTRRACRRRCRWRRRMTLARLDEVLQDAAAARQGVGAFNVVQIEHAEALVVAAETTRLPVVLQISENAVRYHGALAPIALATKAIAERAEVPCVLHLDHAVSESLVDEAVELGFTSVMFDGSALDDASNRERTRAVARRCHAAGVSVEAELGEIGGKDGVHAPGVRTDPAQAARFAAETGVDALAVAVGSSHAMTSRTAQIDLDLVAAIHATVPVPLVLHGSSGVPDADLVGAVEAGMTKINIATHLNRVFTAAVREYLAADPAVVDTRRYLGAGRVAVEDETIRLMSMLARR